MIPWKSSSGRSEWGVFAVVVALELLELLPLSFARREAILSRNIVRKRRSASGPSGPWMEA